MAASTLSEPGSKYGPCERECECVDCAAVRKMAAAVCRICKVPIGYGIRFYSERTHPEGGPFLVHAVCYEEELERTEAQAEMTHDNGDHARGEMLGEDAHAGRKLQEREGAPEVEGPTRADLAEMRDRIRAGLDRGRGNGGSP